MEKNVQQSSLIRLCFQINRDKVALLYDAFLGRKTMMVGKWKQTAEGIGFKEVKRLLYLLVYLITASPYASGYDSFSHN